MGTDEDEAMNGEAANGEDTMAMGGGVDYQAMAKEWLNQGKAHLGEEARLIEVFGLVLMLVQLALLVALALKALR